jgi:hypothetical protein
VGTPGGRSSTSFTSPISGGLVRRKLLDETMMESPRAKKPITKSDLFKLASSALLESIDEAGYADAIDGVYVSVYDDQVRTQMTPDITHVLMSVKLKNCHKQTTERDLNAEDRLVAAGDIYEALKSHAEALLP